MSQYDRALLLSLKGQTTRVKNIDQIVPGLLMLSQSVEPQLLEVLSVKRGGWDRFVAKVTGACEKPYRLSFSLHSWVGAEVIDLDDEKADRESELIDQAELLAEWTGAKELLEVK